MKDMMTYPTTQISVKDLARFFGHLPLYFRLINSQTILFFTITILIKP